MPEKSIREIIKLSVEWLEKKGIDECRLEVELLLAHTLGCKRLDLFLDLNRPLMESELAPFRALLKQRSKRKPLAYILGQREFYALKFKVGPEVLIPRPDTEHLVDSALDLMKARLPKPEPEKSSDESPEETAGETTEVASDEPQSSEAVEAVPEEAVEDSEPAAELPVFRWVDVGTGSGCIAVSVAKNAPIKCEGYALDISKDALALAKENAKTHEQDSLTFLQGHLLEPLIEQDHGDFDLVMSNPPYIAESEKPELAPEVIDHEPALALFDEADDGLALTRELAEQARQVLKPGGWFLLEIGAGRGEAARAVFEDLGYKEISFKRDYGSHERVLSAQWPGETS